MHSPNNFPFHTTGVTTYHVNRSSFNYYTKDKPRFPYIYTISVLAVDILQSCIKGAKWHCGCRTTIQ